MGGDPFNRVRVAVKKLRDDAILPRYSSAEAAGADLFAWVDVGYSIYAPDDPTRDLVLKPGEHQLVKTGIAIELEPGYQAEIRSRSGLALKSGIVVLNSPGTIDSDYRGEIGVILANHGQKDVWITHGDRIAQMVIMPVVTAEFEEVAEELSATERGEGGFGSTGVAAEGN